jgi:Dolichyl-phosphate-mannose-protein mannosyltransferase
MLSRSIARRLLSTPAFWPLACVALALVRRASAWDPDSLWLDDLWMALALRHRDFEQLTALHLPSPIGFLALEQLAARVSDDPEWPLQIVPALCGLLAIPVFYRVMQKLVTHPLALGLACMLVAFHPAAELYAQRVKHYTLDILVVSCLLGLMVDALRARPRPGAPDAPSAPSLARFALLAAAALAFAPFSFSSLFVSLCFVHALLASWLWPALRERRFDRTLAAALCLCALFDLGVLALHQTLLADQSGPTMKWFWRTYFLHFDSAGGVALWFARRLLAWPMYALSWPLLVLAPLTYVGLAALAADARLRPLCWALSALAFGLIVAAALDIYPMGAERTGQFTYPLIWAFTAVGADRLLAVHAPHGSRRRNLQLGLMAYVALVCLARPLVKYDDALDRQVVAEALRMRRNGDGLLMQHTGLLAFAYYGGRPLRFERYEGVCHRFAALPDWPDLEVLPIAVGETMLRDDPSVADPLLGAFYGRHYARIQYVSTHATESIDAHVVARAQTHGYRVQRFDKSPRARLFVFERDALGMREAPDPRSVPPGNSSGISRSPRPEAASTPADTHGG